MTRDDEIEACARSLRIKLGIDDQLRPDIITVVFKLKESGLIKGYIRIPDHQMLQDEAKYDSFSKLLHLRESTFEAGNGMFPHSDAARRRARFTIAHEIGHVALGHTGVRFRGNTGAKAEEMVTRIRREEYEA
jgi:Zn-dependent peptidase ImmA (M78 family)